MLRKVRLECPQCGLVCRIYLVSGAAVMVVRCPSCATSLMTCGGKAAVLTETEMEAVERGEAGPVMAERLAQVRPRPAGAPHPLPSPSNPSRAAEQISYDDVVDLYRDLEMCADSAEFIACLG